MPNCPHVTKAPAAELRRQAQAALQDLPRHLQPELLQRFASSNVMNTAERDLLRVLRDVGLVFPLPVHDFTWAAITVSYLKLGSWFRYLLNVKNGGQLLMNLLLYVSGLSGWPLKKKGQRMQYMSCTMTASTESSLTPCI